MKSALVRLVGASPQSMVEVSMAPARIERSGRIARRLIWLFVALLLLSSTLVRITGAVVAQGYVGLRNSTRQVMHPTGGVINEILVSDGLQVRKGQLLARLNTDVSGITAQMTQESVLKSLARRARLMAERDGLAVIAFPAELLGSTEPAAAQVMREEVQLFNLRRQDRQNARLQLGQRMQQTEQQVSSYYSQIETLNKQKALIQPELAGIRDLWKRGLVTINRLNQLERAAVDVDGSIAALRAQIAQVRAHSAELREQLASVDQGARSQAGLDLAQVDSELNDDQMRNASATDQLKRSEIRAPYEGIVEKLRITKPGEVLQASQPLLDIVPIEQSEMVEIRVEPSDVARIKLGANARVVFPAVNTSSTPEVQGTITYISAEKVTDPRTGVTFYTAYVRLIRKPGGAPTKFRSGMPAEVYVTTGSRSLMSYLLKPLSDQISRAFRYM